jgi:hypothetical protein
LGGVKAGVGLGVKALRVPQLLASDDRANDTERHCARNKMKAFMVYMVENSFEKDDGLLIVWHQCKIGEGFGSAKRSCQVEEEV